MNSPRFLRVFLLFTIVAVMVVFSSVLVSAGSFAEFSLSDTQVNKNRQFEVILCCKTEDKLSSFVAEFTYDSEVVSFDSASVIHKSAQHSVNSSEKGKLTAVYLDEDGISCKENTALMSFKFKALCAGNTEINLSVRDAITCDSANVEVLTCAPSQVVISQSAISLSDKNKEDSDSDVTDSEPVAINGETDTTLIKGTTNIGGVDFSNQTIVSVVLTLLCVMSLALYLAYRAGTHRQMKKLKPAPLEYKEKAGSNINSD